MTRAVCLARFLARAALIPPAGACLLSSAMAQEVSVSPAPDVIAVITIFNDWTMNVDETITVETPRGMVSLRYTSTPNGCDDACSADRVDVVQWPEGTLPDAVSITINEREFGFIVLREWRGM